MRLSEKPKDLEATSFDLQKHGAIVVPVSMLARQNLSDNRIAAVLGNWFSNFFGYILMA